MVCGGCGRIVSVCCVCMCLSVRRTCFFVDDLFFVVYGVMLFQLFC